MSTSSAGFDLAHLPPPLRPAVSRWWERVLEVSELAQACRGIELARWRSLSRCVALSEFSALALLRDTGLLLKLLHEGAGEESEPLHIDPQSDEAQAMTQLRQWRRREMVRLLWRDLNGEATVEKTLRALSGLADQVFEPHPARPSGCSSPSSGRPGRLQAARRN